MRSERAHSLTHALFDVVSQLGSGVPAQYVWRSVPDHPSHFIQSKLRFILKNRQPDTSVYVSLFLFFPSRDQRLPRSKADSYSSYEIADSSFYPLETKNHSVTIGALPSASRKQRFFSACLPASPASSNHEEMRASDLSIIGYFSH